MTPDDHGPHWSIDSHQRLAVDVNRPATIDALHKRYGVPLLCLTSFVSDRPDCFLSEVVLNPSGRERAEIWRCGPRFESEPWDLLRGYLFWADELPRLSAAFARWWRLHAESPALGLFADHINLGLMYSQPRFLTLYAAVEGYSRLRVGQNNLRRLRDYARVDVAAHGCSNDAIALIGASRDYVAHFARHHVAPEAIINTLPASTRRLHALMQACLLRDMGFGKRQAESILERHHRRWPLPSL